LLDRATIDSSRKTVALEMFDAALRTRRRARLGRAAGDRIVCSIDNRRVIRGNAGLDARSVVLVPAAADDDGHDQRRG
jgi:hypothetical protein